MSSPPGNFWIVFIVGDYIECRPQIDMITLWNCNISNNSNIFVLEWWGFSSLMKSILSGWQIDWKFTTSTALKVSLILFSVLVNLQQKTESKLGKIISITRSIILVYLIFFVSCAALIKNYNKHFQTVPLI